MASVKLFFALGTDCMFSALGTASARFSRLAPVKCFPALGNDCTILRTCYQLYVFSTSLYTGYIFQFTSRSKWFIIIACCRDWLFGWLAWFSPGPWSLPLISKSLEKCENSHKKNAQYSPATGSFPTLRVLISMQDLGGAYSPSLIQYQMYVGHSSFPYIHGAGWYFFMEAVKLTVVLKFSTFTLVKNSETLAVMSLVQGLMC